jgi:hypothetical protein
MATPPEARHSIADGTVQAIHSVINPDKLSHLGPVSAMAVRPGGDQGSPG